MSPSELQREAEQDRTDRRKPRPQWYGVDHVELFDGYPERREAVFRISEDTLFALLLKLDGRSILSFTGLPDGCELVSTTVDNGHVDFRIRHPSFEPVAPGEQLLFIPVGLKENAALREALDAMKGRTP